MTKGQMIKDLKKAGVRKAVKEGVGLVKLEHLKFYQVCNLWTETFGENAAVAQ